MRKARRDARNHGPIRVRKDVASQHYLRDQGTELRDGIPQQKAGHAGLALLRGILRAAGRLHPADHDGGGGNHHGRAAAPPQGMVSREEDSARGGGYLHAKAWQVPPHPHRVPCQPDARGERGRAQAHVGGHGAPHGPRRARARRAHLGTRLVHRQHPRQHPTKDRGGRQPDRVLHSPPAGLGPLPELRPRHAPAAGGRCVPRRSPPRGGVLPGGVSCLRVPALLQPPGLLLYERAARRLGGGGRGRPLAC
mmetsp:Transcript_26785/g.86010  ORF Transcript_26785/g.86010 Transcript_26785/m.86010 type:complete len:251 (-) Transcript_26785:1141-1893(-)